MYFRNVFSYNDYLGKEADMFSNVFLASPNTGSNAEFSEGGEDGGGEEEDGALRRLESEFMQGERETHGGGGDLFSEIHLNELKKLEKKLEEVGCLCSINVSTIALINYK